MQQTYQAQDIWQRQFDELAALAAAGTHPLAQEYLILMPLIRTAVASDPVAVDVCKSNHKDDGIEHVYIDEFEDIYGTGDEADEGKIMALLNDHGPIDFVPAAAPCTNYTGLNAFRDEASENVRWTQRRTQLARTLQFCQP